ncbi:hypothetical protein AAFF_G00278450 [Aldrovandia affinis]|uniref:Uncharacterized protein n=1 Tax=Aldrovandia affinis TaxID=143900 RepID=A0AAD7ST05_9TELE|nr:hypothetical protein AAFF_G00278450 [Aldrovandia affinis]
MDPNPNKDVEEHQNDFPFHRFWCARSEVCCVEEGIGFSATAAWQAPTGEIGFSTSAVWQAPPCPGVNANLQSEPDMISPIPAVCSEWDHRKKKKATGGQETAGPENTGLETAGSEAAGPETTSPETAGPEAAGQETAGPETTSLEIAHQETAGPEETAGQIAGPGAAISGQKEGASMTDPQGQKAKKRPRS